MYVCMYENVCTRKKVNIVCLSLCNQDIETPACPTFSKFVKPAVISCWLSEDHFSNVIQ
uniref:Uncharacterized protein n=1 Tax=Anguilla anguilla TaxID=7936 RepID=A0A0E9X813_ANGAN